MKKNVLKSAVCEVVKLCKSFNHAFECLEDVNYWENLITGMLIVFDISSIDYYFKRVCPNGEYTSFVVNGVSYDID